MKHLLLSFCLTVGLISCGQAWNESQTQNLGDPNPGMGTAPAPTHMICGTNGVVKENATPIPPGVTNPVAFLSERGIPVFELYSDAMNPQPRGYVEGGELVAASNVHANGLSKIHFTRPRPGEYWVRLNALCPLP